MDSALSCNHSTCQVRGTGKMVVVGGWGGGEVEQRETEETQDLPLCDGVLPPLFL